MPKDVYNPMSGPTFVGTDRYKALVGARATSISDIFRGEKLSEPVSLDGITLWPNAEGFLVGATTRVSLISPTGQPGQEMIVGFFSDAPFQAAMMPEIPALIGNKDLLREVQAVLYGAEDIPHQTIYSNNHELMHHTFSQLSLEEQIEACRIFFEDHELGNMLIGFANELCQIEEYRTDAIAQGREGRPNLPITFTQGDTMTTALVDMIFILDELFAHAAGEPILIDNNNVHLAWKICNKLQNHHKSSVAAQVMKKGASSYFANGVRILEAQEELVKNLEVYRRRFC